MHSGEFKTSVDGKKVLFISYFFPPVSSTGVPGALRSVKFLRHLQNVEAWVITKIPERHDIAENALPDTQVAVNSDRVFHVKEYNVFNVLLSARKLIKRMLRRENDEHVEIEAQPVFQSIEDGEQKKSTFQKIKDFVYHCCYFPDQAGPWIIPAVLTARRLVKTNKIDVVVATGSPWSSLIVAYLVNKLTGVPYICDFRDPWIANPFHHSKGKLLDKLAEKLEHKIVLNSFAVSLNTMPLMKQFQTRYPDIAKENFEVIPNGFDSNEFSSIARIDEPASTKNTITLTHAGFLYGLRDPATLLDAMRKTNELIRDKNLKFCFKQIGAVSLSYDVTEKYSDLVKDGSLQLLAPMAYRDCLCELKQADYVVNIQPKTTTQVPSKLYDYLALSRPIINITPMDGALGELVREYNFGYCLDFGEVEELTSILWNLSQNIETQSNFSGYENKHHFDIRKASEKLADLIRKSY